MNTFLKRLFETYLKCRIYRNSLPRGTDIFFDIDRHFGIKNFQVVFDIGANIGQSAISYINAFPEAKIYSFEPVSESFQALLKNTDGSSRIQPFNFAFGNESGTRRMYTDKDSTGNSFHNNQGTEEIAKIRRIDEFLEESATETVDFMKIDTEGFELEVLSGAKESLKQHRIGILYIESEPFRTERNFVPFSELVDFIYEYGYELFGIYEQQPHWSGEKSILYFNPVFICKQFEPVSLLNS